MTKLLDRPWARGLAASAIAGGIRAIERSGRWELELASDVAERVAERRGTIGAFWHNRMLLVPLMWRRLLAEVGREPSEVGYTLSSHHRDAELMVATIGKLGVAAVRGSPRRGGADAMRKMAKLVKDGAGMSLAVDGPVGPRYVPHDGALYLSALTGAPIAPLTFSAERRYLADSWDRLMIPWPFGRGVLKIGPLIAPPEGRDAASIAAARDHLQRVLRELSDGLEGRFGHAPLEAGVAKRSRKAEQGR